MLLLGLAAGLISCGEPKNTADSEDSQIAKATRFIDQGDYDKAIELLESLHAKSPSARGATVLASAYAGRAGIKVENYWNLIVGYNAFAKERTTEVIPDLIPRERFPRNADPEVKAFLENVNVQAKELQGLRKKAEEVPRIEPRFTDDLHRAREVLLQAPSAGAKLYRALLTVVILKSDVEQTEGVYNQWKNRRFNFCRPEAVTMVEFIYSSMVLVNETLEDLKVVYPEEKENYSKVQRELQLGISFTENLAHDQNVRTLSESLCAFQR